MIQEAWVNLQKLPTPKARFPPHENYKDLIHKRPQSWSWGEFSHVTLENDLTFQPDVTWGS
jgi:hypothetical protein